MKTIIFAANWKLNKGPRETREFFQSFKSLVSSEVQKKIVFFVPATNLEATAQSLMGTDMRFGSQNCYTQAQGAFTGEISVPVVKEIGAQFILLGHSERRQLFGETDAAVAAKGKLVQSLGLIPMLCVGETLEEREAGQTKAVCERQIKAFMESIDCTKEWVVAYEPVWAIGTGRVASAQQVAEAHAQIREYIVNQGGSRSTAILYGGSVKPENAAELLQIPDVNGFLVGGASLEAVSFSKICLAQ